MNNESYMVWTIQEGLDFIFYLPGLILDWIGSLPIWFAIVLFFLWGLWLNFADYMGWSESKSMHEKVEILWEKYLSEEE